MRAPPLLRRSSNKAAALIIVLAFVVLVTGLALAYFTRTTSDRQKNATGKNGDGTDPILLSNPAAGSPTKVFHTNKSSHCDA